MDLFQVTLDEPLCSGRAIRFRPLTIDERDKVSNTAAAAIGTDGTMFQLRKKEWRLGVQWMVQQVTTTGGLHNGGAMSKDIQWRKMNAAQLDDEFGHLFNARDMMFLEALYRQYNEITEDEVKAISKKVLPVSVD
jgi:hypothetical protein